VAIAPAGKIPSVQAALQMTWEEGSKKSKEGKNNKKDFLLLSPSLPFLFPFRRRLHGRENLIDNRLQM
jgi:hypothetical protein